MLGKPQLSSINWGFIMCMKNDVGVANLCLFNH